MRGVWLTAFALVGIGCASLPPCPHRGGPPWREYVTAHFEVRTDLDPDDAEEVVRSLEETRATMLATAWGGGAEPRDRTQVVVLASRSALEVFTGRADGMFVRRPPFATTLLFAGVNFATLPSLRHELAHDLGRWFLPVQPDWFSEGAAAYLETARYDRDLQRGYMGEVPVWRIRGIWNGGIFDIDRVLHRPTPDDPWEMGRFEDTSWLLFHYLINSRSDAFKRFQRRLGELQPSPQAWKAEFPDLDSATLEATLTVYSRSGKFNVGYRTIAPWVREVRMRSMSDAEVHGVRAFLYSSFRPPGGTSDTRAAVAELEDAFREERPPLEALALAFYGRGEWHGGTRAKLAEQAVAARPDSPLAWLMVADSKAIPDPAYRAALVRALARGPDNRDVLERLTFLTAHQRRWQDALVFSTKALDNGSVRDDLRLAHLRALAMTGQCGEAALWANVLVSLGPKQPPGLSALWDALKKGCVPAPPPAAADQHPGERASD
jgi:hypothetical protein